MRKPFSPTTKLIITTAFAATLAQIGCFVHSESAAGSTPSTANTPIKGVEASKTASEKAKVIEINLDKSQSLSIPVPKKDLMACGFSSKNGWSGWSVRIPGQRNITTPAVYKNKLFFGGGYGSHEFYCLSAATGKVIWQYKTDDDGPSAAVVEDGYVAFNTESCTVFVLSAETGKCIWKEWLGDPLMSQPAISKGRLYIAYPSGQRNHKPQGHMMLCADLKTGKHLWEKPITADVISAPIVDNDKLYFTCMEGTSFCLNASSGRVEWTKENGGTSAPVIADGKFIVARKEMRKGTAYEGLQVMDSNRGVQTMGFLAGGHAPYLQGATNGTIGPQGVDSSAAYSKMDASVGFGGGAPAAAQMSKAQSHMGINTVAGAWGYQGAKAFAKSGRVLNSQGTNVNSVDARTGKLLWQATARSKSITGRSQVFSPPSLGKENMYLISGDGQLVSVDIKDGRQRYNYALNQPISFQPALDQGNIYMGTANGMVVCLKTGDQDADGWSSWGGNAQHNQQK